jgi:hypothetical protein
MALESALLFETPEQIYERVFRILRPRTPVPRIEVRFKPFANANSTAQWKEGLLKVNVTDVLSEAPAPVIEALAYILLSKMFRRPVPAEFSHRYRRYLNRRDVRGVIEKTRQSRGRKLVLEPRGSVYDLETIFNELNLKYFFGLMPRPALGWSLRPSRGILGHYDDPHNTIVISRLLDRPDVPPVAVEYVMFHEMLHIRYPVQHSGARRCVHTREFKTAEKQFDRLTEAKAALSRLPRT